MTVWRLYESRKKILVTGGAGFIGSHLVDRLLAQGHEVLCVDNLYTGTKRNIEHLHSHPRFEFLRHDITLPLHVEVDEIYNLACPASPVHYQHDPVQTTKTSVHGAINMLDLARRSKARIFQASTSEVYGDPQVHPQKESYWGNVNPNGLRVCYIDDVVDAILRLMETDKAVTGPVNIGNPAEVAIRDLAERILRITGSSSPVEFRRLPSDDPQQRRPDIQLARDLLDWAPTVSLDEGLKRTTGYFRGLLPELRPDLHGIDDPHPVRAFHVDGDTTPETFSASEDMVEIAITGRRGKPTLHWNDGQRHNSVFDFWRQYRDANGPDATWVQAWQALSAEYDRLNVPAQDRREFGEQYTRKKFPGVKGSRRTTRAFRQPLPLDEAQTRLADAMRRAIPHEPPRGKRAARKAASDPAR